MPVARQRHKDNVILGNWIQKAVQDSLHWNSTGLAEDLW